MNSFASLMAISATHTRENQLAVQHALQERQRKEAIQRKQQQEREAKEKEMEKKLRIQRFEEEKRQKEKMERMEAELRAKELARERKEEEQRNALLYGRKKAAKMAASHGSSPQYPQSAAARRRLGDDLDDEDLNTQALTREEIRQKKKDAELRRQLARSSTRKSTTGGYRKGGQSLPGGAVNIVVNANGESVTPVSAVSSDPTGVLSLKERLTQGPNTLVLLQTKVRDRRTVDEAQQDIRIKLGKATSKVLSGEDARGFDDWFGNSKEKEKNLPKGSPAPRSSSSTPAPSTSSSRTIPTSTPTNATTLTSSQKKAASTISRSSSTKPTASSHTASKVHKTSSSNGSKPTPSSSAAKSAPPKLKRRRSFSRSESPPLPPAKRPRESGRFDIWEHMTGRPKSEYVMKDIDSDESDMEADAFSLETEERVSSRIALKEDQVALEEERRHEEEKRRRKKEKQRAMARGY